MNRDAPLISILIPNYNKAPYIRETLDSVLNQTYQNWECIVVDDHSTDESWGILEEYSAKDNRFRIYRRPDHLAKGGNVCRNYAFELSKGEYINWFDSDDLMISYSLECRVSRIGDNDFVVLQGVFWDKKSDYGMIINKVTFEEVRETFLNLTPAWVTPSLLIKKEFLVVNNVKWNEELPFFQDVIYNFRIACLTRNFETYFNTIDWIWVDVLESVGKKGSQTVDPEVHLKFLVAIYYELFNFPDGLKRIILLRIHYLFKQGSQNGNKTGIIKIYCSFLKEKNLVTLTEYYFYSLHIFFGITGERYNSRLCKSIYYRLKKMIASQNRIKNSFLAEKVSIKEVT
ncbi:glycosyltransferase family 2 protein [Echinicola soli]|uniref:Glycosyltransferase family 2 protein n=1 Tax=Echinicola soli TaxID=2591634 RepID=A0A514CJ05_9BACT|nr:glycosyltransferase family 2 protein [Echinicola soli]QDH79799.1 glycosyltransferase family 2 protein [Echinicola soli]